MEIVLNEINVTLSEEQKEKIFLAFVKKENALIWLDHENLTGKDTLLVPERSFKWNDFLVSDKENFHDFDKLNTSYYGLTQETFLEMEKYGFFLVPSINDKGVKNFRLYSPPGVNVYLEKARKNNEYIIIHLDYALLSNESTEYSVFKNLRKLIQKS